MREGFPWRCRYFTDPNASFSAADVNVALPFKRVMGVAQQMYSLALPPRFDLNHSLDELWRIKRHFDTLKRSAPTCPCPTEG